MAEIPKAPLVTESSDNYNNRLIDTMKDLTTSFSFFKESSSDLIEEVGTKIDDKDKKITNIFEKIGSNIGGQVSKTVGSVKSGISDLANKTIDTYNTTRENLISGLVGPFKLLTEPIKDLTGIDFVKKIGRVGEIKPNMNPSKKDLSKTPAGQAELYRENQLKKMMGKDTKSKIDLGKIGANVGKFLPFLLKAGAIALIAGGIIWAIIDGIKGALLAKKWGVSKISAFIGSFLAGTGSGWKNAFKSAGKWALVGAGIGLLAGPVGALAGGLIGAAIGGIMGYFGGEKLAKGFDKIGKWFKNSFFQNIFGFFKNLVKSFKKEWKPGKSLAFNLGSGIKGVFTFLGKSIIGFFKSKGNFGGKGALIGLATGGPIGALIGGGIGLVIDAIKGLIAIDTTGIESQISVGKIVKEKIGDALKFIGNIVFDFLDGITGGKLTESIEVLKEIDPLGKIKDFLVNVKDTMFGFFTYIGDFFGFLKHKVEEKGILGLAKTLASGKFGEELGTYRDIQTEKRAIEEKDIPRLSEEVDKILNQKNKTDQEMLEELKKLNTKEFQNQIVNQTNVSTNKYDANNYRKPADYRKAYGR